MKLKNKLIEMVNQLSPDERLELIEAVLKEMRESPDFQVKASPNSKAYRADVIPSEEASVGNTANSYTEPRSSSAGILALTGILSEDEAREMKKAIEETRKIDPNEW
mgnify:CR=1 FL=1